MTIQDKEKVYELLRGNQVLAQITWCQDILEREIQWKKMDNLTDKKMSKKIKKLNDLMKQASELAKEIETNFYGY
jgi:hypothetical protein